MLHELKRAGLSGFTIHIDSHQNRPGWKGKSEKDLNELRQKYADMIAAERGLYLIFNSTVYPSSFNEIPDIVRWGNANIDRVHGIVFITYRTATTDNNIALNPLEKEVDMSKLSYVRESFDEKFVTSPEVYAKIKEVLPEYEPSGYLGGTVRHDSFKWLIATIIGSKKRTYGSLGKHAMEIAQNFHHYFTGTYLAYLSQARIGGKVFLLSPFDKGIRSAWKNRIKDYLRHPSHFFQGVYVQSVSIIQAPDVLEDGRCDMCDSCPDITILDGKFVNSCRMDEYRLFGGFVTVVEKEKTDAK
jgi:hypothetical protein